MITSCIISYGTTIFLFLPALFLLSLWRPLTALNVCLLGLVLGAAAFVPVTLMEWKSSGPDSGPPTESFLAFLGRWSAGSATMISKLLGRVEIPADCASLHLGPLMRVPTVVQAEGVIHLNEVSFTFRPTPHRFGWRFHSLLKDLSFVLYPNEVSAVEPADARSPVMRTFDLPFTRVRTSKPSPIDNFLLCVGGSGRIAMPRIRTQSRDLRERLLFWHTVSQQGAVR
jgi:hypothetical protein